MNDTPQSAISLEQRELLVQELDQELETIASDKLRLLAPLLEGNAEAMRNIVTVSGGALIATITLVQFVVDKIKNPHAAWLLPACWIFFGITIFGALYHLAAITQFRSLPLQFANERLLAADVTNPLHQSGDELKEEVINRVNKRMLSIKTVFDVSRILTTVSFFLAFVSLIVFAVVNLPI